MAARAGWGEHNIPAWDNLFKILRTSGQSSIDIDTTHFVINAFIAGAKECDKPRVHADADAYALPNVLAAIDMADDEANLYSKNDQLTGARAAGVARQLKHGADVGSQTTGHKCWPMSPRRALTSRCPARSCIGPDAPNQ